MTTRKSKWDVQDTNTTENPPAPNTPVHVPGTSLVTIHDSVTGQQITTFVKEIEINGSSSRHILTKGATLNEVS